MTESSAWNITFYQDARGRRPVEEWLSGLEDRDRARVRQALDLLKVYGVRLGMPHSRHLHGKLWELRVAAGRMDHRIVYVAVIGKRFVLLHAFPKKTPKTPARELEIAETRLADYLTRTGGG